MTLDDTEATADTLGKTLSFFLHLKFFLKQNNINTAHLFKIIGQTAYSVIITTVTLEKKVHCTQRKFLIDVLTKSLIHLSNHQKFSTEFAWAA